MTILLVNPPVNRLCKVAVNYFPLGIGYLSATTNRMGYETRIYNAELDTEPRPFPTVRRRLENHRLFIEALQDDSHPVWLEFRSILRDLRPRIVGFSCTSASFMPAVKMARITKELTGAVTVFGGMHATILPEETASYEHVDYIIVGEAERSFPEFVATLAGELDPLSVPGVGTFREGRFYLSDPYPLQEHLELLPFPDRNSLVHLESHVDSLDAIITSRGCPYGCTYCSGRKIHGGRVRFRPIEDVVDEIRMLSRTYNIGHFTFSDDAFVLNRRRIAELCEAIGRARLRITWGAFTRVDSVDRELLRLMKAAGCTSLGCGVESGSDRVLENIGKGYTRAQAIKGIQMIKESGIRVAINVMVGFPFEREEDIRETIGLMEELDVPTEVNTVTPYPGSQLFEQCTKLGLIETSPDWVTLSQHSTFNCFVKEISGESYRKLLFEMAAVGDRITGRRRRYLRRLRQIWDYSDHHAAKFVGALVREAWRRASRGWGGSAQIPGKDRSLERPCAPHPE